ncbi:MAG: N-acetylmuramoyl-L-alanine amidase family protein [Bdellovibrionota bacterium]
MPRGKKVTPLFGIFLVSLSVNFATNENKALAAEKPYIIVLDPGHGGADQGANGRLGKKRVYEKDISLAIALRTAKILSDPAYSKALGRRIHVILTRRKNQTVSLEARADRAKNAHADLFVSIHANSETTHGARGLETYFLNNTDDKSSLKLQQIENRTSKRSRPKKDDLLLRSIAADAVVESSHSAAQLVQSSISDQLRANDISFIDRGVKQALLYVLLDSQVPAVLVECFYLSNQKDLALVMSPENRAQIAEGLAKGVLRFLATK